jgi:[ribosomal protein S18]-alanine N-acetyltransferase
MAGMDLQLRPAVLTDQRQVANLMQTSQQIHRHLDWRYPLDWLGASPFYVLETQGQLSAALACPPDPPQIAWVRLFVNSGKVDLEAAWGMLWEAARRELARTGNFLTAAIALQDWYAALLAASGFTSHQSIVMLAREDQIPAGTSLPSNASIRKMMQFDLPKVAEVDACAFALLWQNSLASMELAYLQSALATVVELNGQIVGYQLSTRNPFGTHLARLAVLPELQGKGLGRALVADLIQETGQHGLSRLTVNTQSDNAASLALYKNIGFRETGERFPVYQLQVA